MYCHHHGGCRILASWLYVSCRTDGVWTNEFEVFAVVTMTWKLKYIIGIKYPWCEHNTDRIKKFNSTLFSLTIIYRDSTQLLHALAKATIVYRHLIINTLHLWLSLRCYSKMWSDSKTKATCATDTHSKQMAYGILVATSMSSYCIHMLLRNKQKYH